MFSKELGSEVISKIDQYLVNYNKFSDWFCLSVHSMNINYLNTYRIALM